MVTLLPHTATDLQVRERLWLSEEDGSKQVNPPEKGLSLAGSRKVPAFWDLISVTLLQRCRKLCKRQLKASGG